MTAFARELARMNDQLDKLGAVATSDDGFRFIDETRAPADLIRAYSGLVSYGYANGLM